MSGIALWVMKERIIIYGGKSINIGKAVAALGKSILYIGFTKRGYMRPKT